MFPFFSRESSSTKGWYRIGLLSDFPDVESKDETCRVTPSCKAFTIPNTNNHTTTTSPLEPIQADIDTPGDMKDQVLVFKYKGKIHAVDHQCPHSSFPLSQGRLFDIEDFGVVLSAGITCPKHDWSFDLFSGQGDRGNYKLKVWEVDVRDGKGGDDDKEVWVRRKQRIG